MLHQSVYTYLFCGKYCCVYVYRCPYFISLLLVSRFELPYNIWCNGCGSHVGMGVRYNAEKTKVGNYYSTPIYKFRMKCHLCDSHFEIQTDPKVYTVCVCDMHVHCIVNVLLVLTESGLCDSEWGISEE